MSRPIVEFFVAGLVHGEWDLADLRLHRDDKLDFVAEPENPHDPRACRLDWGGKRLGYVPKKTVEEMIGAIDTAKLEGATKFVMRVINFAPTNPTHRMVLVGMFRRSPAPPVVKPVPTFRKLILTTP